MKKLLFVVGSLNLLFVIGCSKSSSGNNSNSISSSSNFTLVTNNYDSGHYKSKFGANWGISSIPQLISDEYVDSTNQQIKECTIAITFNHKPISSNIYTIGGTFYQPLTDSTCTIMVSDRKNSSIEYQSNGIGNIVNVQVANGLTTISFNDISMFGDNNSNGNSWSGKLSGTIIEGK